MNPTPTGAQNPRNHIDPVDPAATGATASAKGGPARSRKGGRRLNASMIIGAALVMLIVGLALISFVWTPYDANAIDPAARLQGGSLAHPFGTDTFGRDTLTWVMVGARITLLVGVVAVGIALLIGTPIGIISALFAKQPWGMWIDAVIMRANDILLAFPALLLAIIFAAVYSDRKSVV